MQRYEVIDFLVRGLNRYERGCNHRIYYPHHPEPANIMSILTMLRSGGMRTSVPGKKPGLETMLLQFQGIARD